MTFPVFPKSSHFHLISDDNVIKVNKRYNDFTDPIHGALADGHETWLLEMSFLLKLNSDLLKMIAKISIANVNHNVLKHLREIKQNETISIDAINKIYDIIGGLAQYLAAIKVFKRFFTSAIDLLDQNYNDLILRYKTEIKSLNQIAALEFYIERIRIKSMEQDKLQTAINDLNDALYDHRDVSITAHDAILNMLEGIEASLTYGNGNSEYINTKYEEAMTALATMNRSVENPNDVQNSFVTHIKVKLRNVEKYLNKLLAPQVNLYYNLGQIFNGNIPMKLRMVKAICSCWS